MTMAGKNIIITGGSSGLDLAASLLLTEQGARVGMICRDPKRAFMRNEVAKYAVDKPPVLFLADLSSQTQVRSLATEIRSAFTHIDVLINNPGATFARVNLSECRRNTLFASPEPASIIKKSASKAQPRAGSRRGGG